MQHRASSFSQSLVLLSLLVEESPFILHKDPISYLNPAFPHEYVSLCALLLGHIAFRAFNPETPFPHTFLISSPSSTTQPTTYTTANSTIMAFKEIPGGYGFVGVVSRLVLRSLQLVLALAVAGLYGTDINNARRHNLAGDPRWVGFFTPAPLQPSNRLSSRSMPSSLLACPH